MTRSYWRALLLALTVASITVLLLATQVLACTGGGTWPHPC